MQTAGAGGAKAVRVSSGGAARNGESGVGSRKGCDGGVSDVFCHAGERGVHGEIFRMEGSVWGQVGASELTAREAEAFVMLEQEWRTEQTNGQQ